MSDVLGLRLLIDTRSIPRAETKKENARSDLIKKLLPIHLFFVFCFAIWLEGPLLFMVLKLLLNMVLTPYGASAASFFCFAKKKNKKQEPKTIKRSKNRIDKEKPKTPIGYG
jgi:hypothetical protein